MSLVRSLVSASDNQGSLIIFTLGVDLQLLVSKFNLLADNFMLSLLNVVCLDICVPK